MEHSRDVGRGEIRVIVGTVRGPEFFFLELEGRVQNSGRLLVDILKP